MDCPVWFDMGRNFVETIRARYSILDYIEILIIILIGVENFQLPHDRPSHAVYYYY